MKIKPEQIEVIYQKTKEGKSAKEIAELLDITVGMVEYQRKKNNWKSQYNPKKLDSHLEEIKKLILIDNLTDRQISEKFGCVEETVRKFRLANNINRKDKRISSEVELTQDIIEILVGTLLGDSSLQHRNKSTRLRIEHSIKQSEYIYNFTESLKILNPKIYKRDTTHPSICLLTSSTPSLNYLYDIFYPNDKKIIPINLLKETFTSKSLAYLFMDDGFPIRDNNKIRSIGFALCDFSESNLEEFILFLKDKFNLNFKIQHHYNKYYDRYYSDIVLKSDDFLNFTQLILPYLDNWAIYKIQARNSVNLEKSEFNSDDPNPSAIEI